VHETEASEKANVASRGGGGFFREPRKKEKKKKKKTTPVGKTVQPHLSEEGRLRATGEPLYYPKEKERIVGSQSNLKVVSSEPSSAGEKKPNHHKKGDSVPTLNREGD